MFHLACFFWLRSLLNTEFDPYLHLFVQILTQIVVMRWASHSIHCNHIRPSAHYVLTSGACPGGVGSGRPPPLLTPGFDNMKASMPSRSV